MKNILPRNSEVKTTPLHSGGAAAAGVLGAKGAYFHHEWAEFYDQSGRWHPLDLNVSMDFESSDMRRIDLLYDVEANPLVQTLPVSSRMRLSRIRSSPSSSSSMADSFIPR
jgi:hypothetical protein